jgi:hypothetical protein
LICWRVTYSHPHETWCGRCTEFLISTAVMHAWPSDPNCWNFIDGQVLIPQQYISHEYDVRFYLLERRSLFFVSFCFPQILTKTRCGLPTQQANTTCLLCCLYYNFSQLHIHVRYMIGRFFGRLSNYNLNSYLIAEFLFIYF